MKGLNPDKSNSQPCVPPTGLLLTCCKLPVIQSSREVGDRRGTSLLTVPTLPRRRHGDSATPSQDTQAELCCPGLKIDHVTQSPTPGLPREQRWPLMGPGMGSAVGQSRGWRRPLSELSWLLSPQEPCSEIPFLVLPSSNSWYNSCPQPTHKHRRDRAFSAAEAAI